MVNCHRSVDNRLFGFNVLGTELLRLLCISSFRTKRHYNDFLGYHDSKRLGSLFVWMIGRSAGKRDVPCVFLSFLHIFNDIRIYTLKLNVSEFVPNIP